MAGFNKFKSTKSRGNPEVVYPPELVEAMQWLFSEDSQESTAPPVPAPEPETVPQNLTEHEHHDTIAVPTWMNYGKGLGVWRHNPSQKESSHMRLRTAIRSKKDTVNYTLREFSS